MSHAEFESNLKKMTSCQRKAFSYIQNHFMNRKNDALRAFITGGAGVGKSFLLKIISNYLQLFCAGCSGTNPVKCCAPTGPAARNINGQTIHSALKIPVDKYSRLSLSRIPRDSLKYFEISVVRHIRFAELRKK